MMMFLMIYLVLCCMRITQCCDPVDCNSSCKTNIGKVDPQTCDCICYNKVDDIVMPESVWEDIQAGRGGKAVTTVWNRWEELNADGFIRVPFYLTEYLEASASYRSAIIRALGTLNAITCLKFEPAQPDDVDKIEFFNGTGCWSYIGRTGGTQQISLRDGCLRIGTIQHEAMHALGIWHEQSRPDRDNYVKILWDNIQSGKERNFYKKTAGEVTSFSSPYDFTSVMHYHSYSFSKNGERTITRLDDTGFDVQRWAPSLEDQVQINAMHNCNGKRGIPETSNCYHPLDQGFSYRGTASTTKTGKTCQAWSSQSPNGHSFKPDLVTGAGLESNYCRNPDSDPVGPWCYTTSFGTTWEACNITICANAVPAISTTLSTTTTQSPTTTSTQSPTTTPEPPPTTSTQSPTTTTQLPPTTTTQSPTTTSTQPPTTTTQPPSPTTTQSPTKTTQSPTTTPIQGMWNEWGNYSACNKVCGNGKKMRTRTCSTNSCSTGKPFQKANCNNKDCSPAAWGPYGEWSGCHCSKGKRYQVRECIGGVIGEGGCTGRPWRTGSCTCPSGPAGTWSAWGSYSSCHKSCANGKKMQVRTCSTNRCPSGKPFRKANCYVCPADAVWTPYSGWSGCHCSRGRRYRVRQCNGGFITEGGCTGKAWSTQACACSK